MSSSVTLSKQHPFESPQFLGLQTVVHYIVKRNKCGEGPGVAPRPPGLPHRPPDAQGTSLALLQPVWPFVPCHLTLGLGFPSCEGEEGPWWPQVLLMLTFGGSKTGAHHTGASWLVVSTVCGRPTVTGKIFGDKNSPDQRWPWQASLLYLGRHICGATLIDAFWVISAAHCFQKCVFPKGPANGGGGHGKGRQDGQNQKG